MEKFSYKLNKRGNASISYIGSKDSETIGPRIEDHVYIPREIEGHVVDEILENGFSLCEETLSIYVPNTVKFIGKNAFKHCINAIIYFEANCFDYNEKLHEGDAPDVHFGINKNNFLRDENFDYLLKSDGSVLLTHYNNGQKKIVLPSKITINDKEYKVTGISKGCFETPNVWDAEEIVIPSSLKDIPNDVFNRCENSELKYL